MKINIKNLDRNVLYTLFQSAPLTLSEKELALAFERSRFDSRLFEIVTEHIRDFWWAIDPIYLNQSCKKMKSPFVIKCIVSAILTYCKADSIQKNEFNKWIELACRGIQKPAPQVLMIGGYKINGVEHKKQIELGLDCFKKNNVFYADIPFNKGQGKELKSRLNPPLNQLSQVDLLKQDVVLSIKKISHNLSNNEIIKKLSINRVFLSKILNSKVAGISTDYLLNII